MPARGAAERREIRKKLQGIRFVTWQLMAVRSTELFVIAIGSSKHCLLE